MPRGKNKGIHIKYRDEPKRKCWEVVEYIRGKLKRHATGFSSREDAEENLQKSSSNEASRNEKTTKLHLVN